ncbi:MAG: hypothetical protein LUF90_04465 [Rikenellaceae bacterium]|nr:hypothetical protein [Rikenellaceae bacterium]
MKNRMVDFLKENVLGKELLTDNMRYILEDGKMEGNYSDKMFFSDILTTDNGFKFNLTTITEEKIYLLDVNGEYVEIKKDFTGTSVMTYEIARRKSTGEFTGYMRLLSSTVKDHAMEAIASGVYDIKVSENELSWKENQLLYRDMPTNTENYRPVAFDAQVRLYIENGKLKFEYIPVYSNFDNKTMEKTISRDHYPTYTSKEK